MTASATPAPAVLELRDVRKVFRSDIFKRKQVAIDSLSCRFGQGLCTGLLGHNGAGKTTTIRMILGLVRPDAGEILFEGHPLTTADKRRIGYMPEVAKLPGALTPDEILHYQLLLYAAAPQRTRAARRAAVDAKLAEVGLDGHRNKRVSQLSKGMGRRLAWAQATIHGPSLLILDEPSSGLDPLGRKRMLGWIESEKRRGTSILLCTHEMVQVATLCDDFHVLRLGKLALTSVREGAPSGAGPAAGVRPVGRARYNIHVSGVTELGLGDFGAGRQLAPWVALKQEGFLAVLGFDDYEASARWLAALLAAGYVVVRFGDETFLGEDELMAFFDGET